MIEKSLKLGSWLLALGLVLLTVVPASDRPVTGLGHDVEHFAIFGLMGLAFGAAYAGHQRALLVSAIFFALVLELCQLLLATRHARAEDFIVDAAAACLGIFAARIVRDLVVTQSR